MKKRIEQLKANRNRGASLAIVLCICTVLMAFSLAIVYLAGLLMANANERSIEERAYQLARSFAHVMDQELRLSENTRENGNSSAFYQFANKFVDEKAYLDYNEEYPEATTYDYKVREMPELTSHGDIKVSLTKESNSEESNATEGKLVITNEMNYESEVNRLKGQAFLFHVFHMTVTSTYQDTSYAYEISYYRQDTYQMIFRYQNMTVVWNQADNSWHSGKIDGPKVTLTVGETIDYTYLIEHPVASRFVPMHKEAQ